MVVSTIIPVDRSFSQWGVSFASEVNMRIRANELVEGHLVGENGVCSFILKDGGEEVRTAPHVYVSSLWDKVQALLDQHERYKLHNTLYSPLPWHLYQMKIVFL